jgi:hypothetical protein
MDNPNHTHHRVPGIWNGQVMHVGLLLVLLGIVWTVWGFLEKPFPFAFWFAVSLPVVHQIFVWLAWRLELAHSTTSKTIGFKAYMFVFFVLFGARFVSLFVLASLDRGSLKLPVLPQVLITTILVFPGIYAMYSVMRYFGMDRASGADHFDAKYRDMPLVEGGIFQFTNNGMYVYAFLLFWSIAMGFNSAAALLVAAFSHAYIWVHFFCTEKPDMDYLYSSEHNS